MIPVQYKGENNNNVRLGKILLDTISSPFKTVESERRQMKQCRMQNQKWPNVVVENLTNTAFLYSIHTVAKVTPKEVQKVCHTMKKIVFSLTCVVYLMLHFSVICCFLRKICSE
jgi:hypothetical protein